MTGLGLEWVDIALLAVLVLSVAIGLVRGFTFEVLSLLGWIAAYFAAQWFTPVLQPHLPIGRPGSALQHGAAFALTFVLALVLWGLGVRVVSLLIRSSPLSGFDRLLGAVFGLLRGLVLLLVVVTVVGFTPWSGSPDWRASTGVQWLNSLRRGLVPMLPPDLAPNPPAPHQASV